MANLPSFLVISITINALAITLEAVCNKPALFPFGDSYLEVGNNNFINTSIEDKADFFPYGENLNNTSTGRFTDGRIVPDILAELAKLKGVIPPYLEPTRKIDSNYTGVSFASAGTGAFATTFEGYSVGLAQQLKNFKDEIKNLTRALGSNTAKKIVSNAVYLISLGASDFISPFTLNVTIPDEQQYVNMMIGNLSTVFDTIYDLGGRKFAWLNVLNLACAPGLKAVNKENGCLKKASEIVGLYNEALKTLLSDKEKSLDGSRIVLFDLASGVAKMTAEPTIYGFEEAESACCGSGNSNGIFSCGRIPEHYNLCPNASDHVFFDSFHPTGNAYEQITKEIWNQRNGGVKKLFDCLG